MHLHESPYISIYPSTDCQEPVLFHYKVCCNVVNCSNFPPDLFLKRAEIVPVERKTRRFGRTFLSETFLFHSYPQVGKSQVFSEPKRW